MDGDEERQFRVSVTVNEREFVEDVLACLKESGVNATLDKIVDLQMERPSQTVIDISSVTNKQWEALELAVDQGYYDDPRNIDLEWLSSSLSISKSAVSQRLRGAEATVVAAVVESSRTLAESD